MKSAEFPLHYTKFSNQLLFQNINLRYDHLTKAKRFIHGIKHHKKYQLLSLEHSCVLSLIQSINLI